MQPNPKFDHAFAIVRVDTYHEATVPAELLPVRVTVKKVVWDAAVAEAEVQRLNDPNAGKGCVYFSQVTRVEPKRP